MLESTRNTYFSTVLRCFAGIRLKRESRYLFTDGQSFSCKRHLFVSHAIGIHNIEIEPEESMAVSHTVLSFSRLRTERISSSRSSQAGNQYFPRLHPSWTAVLCCRKTFTSLYTTATYESNSSVCKCSTSRFELLREPAIVAFFFRFSFVFSYACLYVAVRTLLIIFTIFLFYSTILCVSLVYYCF